jgi:hypothetical protein
MRFPVLSGVLLTILLCFSAISPVFAQTTTSTISGNISDGKNPIPDAVVTIVHDPSGTPYYAFSNEKGNYVINDILAGGPYTVRVERLNYKTMIVKEVEAPLGEVVVVDVTLTPSSMRLEEVKVFGEGKRAPMNIYRSGSGVHFSSKEIDIVPTVSRSLYDVLKLTPQSIGTDAGVSIGGGNYRSSVVSVDGASFNNVFGIGSSLPAGGTPISIEAIDRIDVNITPFNVRHSGFTGSSINMITKRGTNVWHGSVYDYMTGSALQGHKVDGTRLTFSPTSNNILGFTVGGPIVKDKLFFFLNGEYTLDYESGSSLQARPDESYSYGGGTGYNRPTVAQMEDIRQFLYDNFGYDPGRYQNYTVKSPDYRLFARLDWRINDNNLFLIRVSHTHVAVSNSPSSSMNPLGGKDTRIPSGDTSFVVNSDNAGRRSQYALPFESARYDQVMNFTTMTAELKTRLMNERGGNTLRLNWSRQNEPRSFEGGIFPTVDIMEPYTDMNGNKQLAMFTTFGPDPFTYGNLRRVNTFTATDEFFYKTGIHAILAGAQIEWNHIENGFMQGGAGWYVYDSWQSFVDDVNGVEGAGPSLFMITHANSDNPTEQVYPALNHCQVSLYAQDGMAFSKFFKMTVGLRLEVPFIRFRYDNRNEDFDQVVAANPNSSFAGLSTADYPHFDLHVSPRIGFNWDITHDRKVILRGGTGLFTGRIPNVWLVSAIGNANCLQYQYIANTATGDDVVGFNNNREDIINSLYASHNYSQQGLPAPTYATILAKNLKMPTSWKSSLAFDFLIPGNIKATVEGVYSFNLNEIYASSLGYTEDGTIQLPGEPEARTHYVSENITNKEGSVMHGYYLHNEKDQHGQYLSLTAQLTKNFRFGLNLFAAYTFSHAKNLSDGNGDQVSSFANTANVNDCNSPELGYSAFVAPHRVIAGLGYIIKEGKYTATKLGIFYEGLNMGIYNGYYMTRHSYLIGNVSGLTSPQLMFIPTAEELAAMPFSSEENRAAFEEFISSDRYLSKHRGEYSKRNGGKNPWLNRINLKVAQEFYFNLSGHKQSLEVGVDINNLGNLLCSKWGAYRVLDSETVLQYDNNKGEYSFTQPTWSVYNNLSSTWQILLHLKYEF